jgi:hypothetical protein
VIVMQSAPGREEPAVPEFSNYYPLAWRALLVEPCG